MNITRENIDELNVVLKITIEKNDYEKPVADQLKEYRQKASIPGFRPGKVPDSIIKRRFRVPVLVDEVNKLLSKKLSEYLVEEKLHIFGEPMPNEELQQKINWETDETFEFDFDVALAPEVKLELGKNDVFQYYQISASDESIDKQIEMAKSQLGQNVPDEEVKADSTVRGDFAQLDENGQAIENGIQPKGVAIAIDLIKNEEIKNNFIGKKKDDVVVFDPVVAFENRHDIKHMLNIKKEEAETLNGNFSFTITEVLKFEEANLDEELFKKIYGEETEVKTLEDFRNRIKADIEGNLVYSSNQKFAIDTRNKLLEATNLQLPVAFLKRWLVAINKELTIEQIEKEFDDFLIDLKWQLIKDTIIKENEIKVIPEEATAFAVEMARAQYQQYGLYDVPAEQLESFARMILEKEEETERIYKRLYEDKVIKAVKEKVTIQETPISQDEFTKLMQ